MALSRIVSEIFNVEKYRDLQIRVKGQSRSLKVLSFDRLVCFLLVFSLCPHDAPFLEYSTSKMPWPWKPG